MPNNRKSRSRAQGHRIYVRRVRVYVYCLMCVCVCVRAVRTRRVYFSHSNVTQNISTAYV